MKQSRDDEIYPNSPLVDVACEIRFPGEMKVECDRHLFWEKIRNKYPRILVPNAAVGQPLAMQHYRFQNEEQTRIVMVALHSLAMAESKYTGHKKFIAELSRIAKIFSKSFPGVKRVTRLGWRYINVIPFEREDGLVPVARFFRARVDLPGPTLDSVKHLDAKFELQRPAGVAAIRLASVKNKENPAVEALLLDLDFSVERNGLTFVDSIKEISKIRSQNRALFEELITDEYRMYLRGEGL